MNEAALATHADAQLYCATLPYSGVRMLHENEVAALKDRRAKAARRFTLWVAGGIAGVILGLVALVFLTAISVELSGDSYEGIAIVASVLVILVGIGGGILFVIGRCKIQTREVRVIDLQMKHDYVRQFAGILSRSVWSEFDCDPAVAVLLKLGLLEFNERKPFVLELFADGDFIYRVGDRFPPRVIPVSVQHAAARPSDAPEYAVPASWVPRVDNPPNLERRHLSAEELNELRGAIRRSIRALIGLFVAIPVLGTYGGSRLGHAWGNTAVGAVCGLAVGTAIGAWRGRYLVRFVRMLRGDVRENWVVIASADPHQQFDSSRRAADQKFVEFLVFSGLQWTIEGRPAPWRGRRD